MERSGERFKTCSQSRSRSAAAKIKKDGNHHVSNVMAGPPWSPSIPTLSNVPQLCFGASTLQSVSKQLLGIFVMLVASSSEMSKRPSMFEPSEDGIKAKYSR